MVSCLFSFFKEALLHFATRVADKLPGPNKALLKHLICVFHHILESADTNKMDAHNLAVCIAPTLLHLNGTLLDEQKEKIEKVESPINILSHFKCFEAFVVCDVTNHKSFRKLAVKPWAVLNPNAGSEVWSVENDPMFLGLIYPRLQSWLSSSLSILRYLVRTSQICWIQTKVQ